MNTSSRKSKALMNQRRKNYYNSLFYLILVLLIYGCSPPPSPSSSPSPEKQEEQLPKTDSTDIWSQIRTGKITTAEAIITNQITSLDGQRNCPYVTYTEIADVRKKVDGAGDFCVARVKNDINAGNVSTSQAIFQGVISWQNAQSQCPFMSEEEKDRVRQATEFGASNFCR
ncbi:MULTISPECIES: hypothetical protein [unclassified Microcoleus]|uniref:hypothetical protein n=1 Tax=unclassified Microcoleus TaxID=2642155 RepID=UPI002FD13894